jgi:hypothetical protein
MNGFDGLEPAALPAFRQFLCVKHHLCGCSTAQLTLTRWNGEWAGPLLLVVALASVAVLRFCFFKTDRIAAVGQDPVAHRSSAETGCSTAPVAHHRSVHSVNQAPVPESTSDAGKARASASLAKSSGSFAEEFQYAVQLKATNKLSECGQRLLFAPPPSPSSYLFSLSQHSDCVSLPLGRQPLKNSRF